MEIRVIDNATQPVGNELLASLRWASDVRIATAFAKRSGVSMIIEPLKDMLVSGGAVQIIYGLDFRITDPEAMEQLTSLDAGYDGVTHYAYSGWELAFDHAFHPKFYMCTDGEGNAQVIIGSSNLTYGGLWKNVETNVVISGTVEEPAIAEASSIFSRIRASQKLVVPDIDYIESYRKVFDKAKILPVTRDIPPELQSLHEDFLRIESHLPSTDIEIGIGWPSDVLACIRDLQNNAGTDSFTLQEFYGRFQETLALKHTQNRNIRKKIQQQMQLLRDRGLLRFEERGAYRIIG